MINLLKKKIKQRLSIKNVKRLNYFYRYFRSLKVKVSREDMTRLRYIEDSFPTVLSTSETLSKIVNDRLSLCRFGDAEFDICNFENENDPYQKPSKELTRRLNEIISSSHKDVVVCIPPFNSKTNNLSRFYGKLSFWEWYWLERFEKIKPMLTRKTYGNSFVTRESVFFENSLDDIKRIWNGRTVVFVFGENGRFDYKHKIFDNVKKYTLIFVPATNAFSKYDSTLKDCSFYPKDTLFLIAAGPTATVLAYDLALRGYQALDVGHLPNSYDEYCDIIVSPESIPMRNDIS
ncbi:GT-D fold domain-containing glycosyltransferase [Vibrio furnissii]|uniref:GT-D fold domain-containing glycosyltransferase n=1 Tax=Vibrio furnissii TaxID=29494 RepID=UPI003AA890E1